MKKNKAQQAQADYEDHQRFIEEISGYDELEPTIDLDKVLYYFFTFIVGVSCGYAWAWLALN